MILLRLLRYLPVPITFFLIVLLLRHIYRLTQIPIIPLLYLPLSILSSLTVYFLIRDGELKNFRTLALITFPPLLLLSLPTYRREKGWAFVEGVAIKSVYLAMRIVGRVTTPLPFPLYVLPEGEVYMVSVGSWFTLSKAYKRALNSLRRMVEEARRRGLNPVPVKGSTLAEVFKGRYSMCKDGYRLVVIELRKGEARAVRLKHSLLFGRSFRGIRSLTRPCRFVPIEGRPRREDVYSLGLIGCRMEEGNEERMFNFLSSDRSLRPILAEGRPWALLPWQYEALKALSDDDIKAELRPVHEEKPDKPPLDPAVKGIYLGPAYLPADDYAPTFQGFQHTP
jgi:hypothetical protein